MLNTDRCQFSVEFSMNYDSPKLLYFEHAIEFSRHAGEMTPSFHNDCGPT